LDDDEDDGDGRTGSFEDVSFPVLSAVVDDDRHPPGVFESTSPSSAQSLFFSD